MAGRGVASKYPGGGGRSERVYRRAEEAAIWGPWGRREPGVPRPGSRMSGEGWGAGLRAPAPRGIRNLDRPFPAERILSGAWSRAARRSGRGKEFVLAKFPVCPATPKPWIPPRRGRRRGKGSGKLPSAARWAGVGRGGGVASFPTLALTWACPVPSWTLAWSSETFLAPLSSLSREDIAPA